MTEPTATIDPVADVADAEPATEAPAKKKLDPDTNIFKMSSRRSHGFGMLVSKVFLKKFEDVELHALG